MLSSNVCGYYSLDYLPAKNKYSCHLQRLSQKCGAFFAVQKTEFTDTFGFNYLSLVTPLAFCSMTIQIKTPSHPAVPLLIVIPSIYLKIHSLKNTFT